MSKDGYRIIFMGTPDFAVPTLIQLLHSDHQVVAVVTQPDKKKGRGKKLASPPVKEVAEQADIPVLQPTKIKTEEFLSELKSYTPDLIVVVAYGRILPKSIFTLPPLGCINVHGSLLPKHRGAAPIQWAIIAGDSKAGVTIMQMNEGMDTGDVLLRAEVDVALDETAGSLFIKLASLGAETLVTALTKLQNDDLSPQKQDHENATKAPPLNKEMGLIDWSKSAEELQCLIRGLDPWPSAYTYLDGKRYRLFSPKVVHKDSEKPAGTVLLADNNGLLITTGSNALLVGELQPEGKKRMSVEAFLCGHPVPKGSRFSSQIPS
jgi:methionyl-tRNA formyltransferase